MTDTTSIDELELRMRVADIAVRPFLGGTVIVPDEIGRVFDVIMERVKGVKVPTDQALTLDRSVRHHLLLAPITTMIQPLTVFGRLIEKLHHAGIYQIGALVQWAPEQLKEHARLTGDELAAVQRCVTAEGLHLAMDKTHLRQWIEQGSSHAKPKDG